MGDSIAERYQALAGAQADPYPPSPARLRFEAAVVPKVDALSGSIQRMRARMRGDDQAPTFVPPTGCSCP